VAQTRWLNSTEAVAWRSFVESIGDLMTAFEAGLAEHDLTLGDYQVLVYLSESDDRTMRMCDLATALRLSPSGLTRRLDGLVKSGLVARNPSVSDRRVMMATLTPTGWKRLQKAAPDHVENVRECLFDHLTPTQVKNMAEVFTAVQAGLAERRGVGELRTSKKFAAKK
jgi:DNA-binding MarR family transcriptional regulator